MSERSRRARAAATIFGALGTALLGASLFPLAGCSELDLTPKLRDYYMGQQLLEPELFNEKPRRDARGDPLLETEAAETKDTVEAP